MKEQLIYPFESEAFFEAWDLWTAYRSEIKKPIRGKISKQAQLRKIARLAEGNEEVALAVIMQSIENNWQGLFQLKTPLKNDNKRKSASDAHERFWA
jgi:hypothetical protein